MLSSPWLEGRPNVGEMWSPRTQSQYIISPSSLQLTLKHLDISCLAILRGRVISPNNILNGPETGGRDFCSLKVAVFSYWPLSSTYKAAASTSDPSVALLSPAQPSSKRCSAKPPFNDSFPSGVAFAHSAAFYRRSLAPHPDRLCLHDLLVATIWPCQLGAVWRICRPCHF